MKRVNNLHKQTVFKNFLLIFLWVAFLNVHGQGVQFSQFYAAPLYLNPALAGQEKDVYFGFNYRSQWNSLESPYSTGQFSIIHPILLKGSEYRHVGGVGFSAFRDVTGLNGEFKTTGINFSGAYNVSLNDNQILFMGLQAGIVQKKVDLSHLRWGSQYDYYIGYDSRIIPSVGDISEKNIFPVFNAGFIWHYEKKKKEYLGVDFRSFLGVAFSNLNRPDESLLHDGTNALPWLYKLHGGLEFVLSRSLKISPNFLIMSQNRVQQYNIGGYVTFTKLGNPYSLKSRSIDLQLGSWYRLKDSFILMMGIGTENMAAGFSYDLNASNLRYSNLVRGTYEMSMSYKILKGKGIRKFATPLM